MRVAAFNKRRKLLGAFAGGLVLAQCGWMGAQTSLSRITKAVDDSARVALHGSVPAAAQSRFDAGSAAATTTLENVQLVLNRSAEQSAALTKLMGEQVNPASANYHKWLTPDELGEQYGASSADIAKITSWLQSKGLTVTHVGKAHTVIEFSGSVAQIQSAFTVSIHRFNTGTQSFLSTVNEPTIPQALASVVEGVARLNTIQPKAAVQHAGVAKFDATHKIVPAGTPAANFGNGYFYVSASDAQTIYDVPNSKYNVNYSSTKPTYDGTGVTIGIGGTTLVNLAPIVAYRSIFLGDTKSPVVTNDFGATEAANAEADLDMEISGGLAPGATIHYYPSPDLFSGILEAADENTVDVFSLSIAICEGWAPEADNIAFSQYWQQFAAQGITVTVASSDSGSAGCDDFDTESVASQGMHVNALASTQYNVAVGGTDFIGLITGNPSNYISSTNTAYFDSALGYIPESTWNDSTWPNGELANNVYTGNGIVAGSGGPSNCAFNTTDTSGDIICERGWPKPYWQGGPGVPFDGARDIPDVSLFAGNGWYGAAWIFCTDADPCSNGYLGAGGGTSAAAPAFAGILADAVQKTHGRLGQVAPALYLLAAVPWTGSAFHDITVGNNSVDCVEGSPDCALDAANNYFERGYNTTRGYDLATGLGSVDATKLIDELLNSYTGSKTATVTVKPSAATVSEEKTLRVTVTVAGDGHGVPTGAVTLATSAWGSQPVPLVDGRATFTISSQTLQNIVNDAWGPDTAYNFIATYSGDFSYAPATGSVAVTITQ